MTLTKEQKPLCVFVCGSVCMVSNDGVMGRGSVQDQKGLTTAPVHTRAVLSPSLALSFFVTHLYNTLFIYEYLSTAFLSQCLPVKISLSSICPPVGEKKKPYSGAVISVFQMMLLKLYVKAAVRKICHLVAISV